MLRYGSNRGGGISLRHKGCAFTHDCALMHDASCSTVDAARSPDSPLHGLFEWDNAKAAAAYRKLLRDSAPLN
jgi:hypothetical protein